MFCEKCGTKIIDGDIFCGGCGNKIVWEEDKTMPIPPVNKEPVLDITQPMQPVNLASNIESPVNEMESFDKKIEEVIEEPEYNGPVFNVQDIKPVTPIKPVNNNDLNEQAKPINPINPIDVSNPEEKGNNNQFYEQNNNQVVRNDSAKNQKPVKEKKVKEKKVKDKKVKEKKKFDGRNVVIILLIVALLASLVSAFLGVIPTAKQLGLPFADLLGGGSSARIEGNGYDSAEAAAEAYINAVNNGDMEALISTFAVESYVDNFNMEANLNRFKAYNAPVAYNSAYEFTQGDDFSRDIRIAQRRSIIEQTVYKQIVYITMYDLGYDISMVISLDDENATKDLMKKIKKASTYDDWKNMELVEFVEPDDIFDDWNDNNEDVIKKWSKDYKKMLGAEEVQNVTALIEARDEEFYQFFTCVKYDGKWYVEVLSNQLSGMAGLGADCKGLCPVDEIN